MKISGKQGNSGRKAITILIAAVLLSFGSVISAFAFPDFSGKGTSTEPYGITCREDLLQLRDFVNSGNSCEGLYFLQTEDIDLSGNEWIPIGRDSAFLGTYDGNGKRIRGLTYHVKPSDEGSCFGLFGELGGVVANLQVTDAVISGRNCGIIAGKGTGCYFDPKPAIVNCYTSGTVSGRNAGGIAGDFNGAIVNCISTASGHNSGENDDFFGILSFPADCKVYNCLTTAEKIVNQDTSNKTINNIQKEDLYKESFPFQWNCKTALSQELFGNHYGVELKEISGPDQSGGIAFSEKRTVVPVVRFFDRWLPLIVLLVLTALEAADWKKAGRAKFLSQNRSRMIASAVIFTILSLFLDCAAIGSARGALSLPGLLFLLLCNFRMAVSLYLIADTDWRREWKELFNAPLITVMVVVLVLELAQFGLTPRYDAHLYYGSFSRAPELFRFDILTYFGAFNVWKWAQGSALLIAPLEFLFGGQIFGVYIANIVITEVTVVLMYRLLRELLPDLGSIFTALSCFLLMVCPYQLGMFTHLCFDNYLTYYAIWLLYAYRKKNNVLIAFVGFLMTFTKVTGLAFYAGFLIAATAFRVLKNGIGGVVGGLRDWWKESNAVLWILPALMFLPTKKYGDFFEIQFFNGGTTGSALGTKSLRELLSTFLQSFVFGYRWLFVLILLAALILILVNRKKYFDVLPERAAEIACGTLTGCILVFILLEIYDGNADCPRYTAIFNVGYVFFLLAAVCCFKTPEKRKRIFLSALTAIQFVQVFWTIDPAILLHRSGIDTGTTQVKRLDFLWREIYEGGYDIYFGDLYSYNLQGNFYDGIIDSMLEDIQPTKDTAFYVLDIYDYELHLHGMQYPMYWNARKQRMTYDGKDPDSIFLKEKEIFSKEALNYTREGLGKEFYLVVPARVSDEIMKKRLQNLGYQVQNSREYSNIYGKLKVFRYTD